MKITTFCADFTINEELVYYTTISDLNDSTTFSIIKDILSSLSKRYPDKRVICELSMHFVGKE
jgi:hypothetical protein